MITAIASQQFQQSKSSPLELKNNKGEPEKVKKIFTDVIQGKGGGRVFLLHGPPGVGKTLTAEAVADLYHRPLYSVTVGELGTSAPELEEKLQEILEVGALWNSVSKIQFY